jgi:hypothetical protein
MKVFAFESADWAEAAQHGLTEAKTIASIERGLNKTAKLLPALSRHLNIVVRPHFEGIIPEYGTGGRTWDTEFVEISFDKTVPHGVERTLESLYQTVFHEGNHAARWNALKDYDGRFIEAIVFEGLATVFERDHADYQPLYGQYEDDTTMRQWFAELSAADWDKRPELFFNHPDGRRWIGYKTGTWLVDRAINHSGKTVVELCGLSADEIIALANLKEQTA